MVGDFGLSKMINYANLGVENNNIMDPSQSMNTIIIPPNGYRGNSAIHTAGVGTASYASPEQTTSRMYGTAADIYSLGLICLELFSNFTSEHERAKAFHECRYNRELPPSIKQYYPEVTALILGCTKEDWRQRPTASDIQASGMFQEKGGGSDIFRSELRMLQKETTKKDALILSQEKQINEKNKTIREKDEIIESLRARLAEVEGNTVTYVESKGDEEGPVDVENSSSFSTHDDD